MRVLIVAIVVSLVAVAAQAATITTGSKKGTYYKVGQNISRALPGNDVVVTSKGSVENIQRIMKDEAQIGLVQMDALAYMSTKDAEVSDKVEVIGPVYKECVYIAVNKNGRVRDEDDLQKEGVTIAVGKRGSGGVTTWDYMRQLEPGYKKAAVEFTGGIRALGKLAAQPDGPIDAVLFVTKPRLDSKLPMTVIQNENLEFLDVNDKDLNDKYKPTGKPIYEFYTVKTKGGVFSGKSIKTICMEAAVVANTDADEETLENLADLVLNYKSSLVK